MYKFIIFLIFFFLNTSLSYSKDITFSDKVIANLNNNAILKSDVDFILKVKDLEFFNNKKLNKNDIKIKDFLKEIIFNNIFLNIFKKDNININNKEINNYIDKVLKNIFLNKNEFINYLNSKDISIRQYEQHIKNKILFKKIINKYIIPKINVSNEEINNFIKNNKNKNFDIDNLFVKYDLNILKVKSFNNIINSNDVDYFKNNFNYFFTNKIKNNKLIINKNKKFLIYKKSIKNIFLKDILKIIYTDYNNKNEIIGPIYKNNIMFLFEKKINTNKLLNNKIYLDDIYYLYIDNNKFNIFNKEKPIYDLYDKLLKNDNFSFNKNFNNIKVISLGYKNINFNNNIIFKDKIDSLKSNLSEIFKFNNNLGFIYVKKIDLNNIEYIKKKWINGYLFKEKSLYLLNALIKNNIKDNYINILD